MISALGLSFTLTYFLYNRFEKMPTRIAIENQFESIKNLPYPAITLCTPNQITKSSLEYFNTTLIEGNRTALETYLPLALGFYEFFVSVTNQTETLLKQFQDLLELNRFTIPDLLARLPQNCEKFLKRCFLEGKQYNCMDLFTPILTAYGYCCSFNNVYMFDGKMNVKNRNFVSRNVRATGLTRALIVVIDYDYEDVLNTTLLFGGSTPVMYCDWSEFPSDDEFFIHHNHGESFHILSATYTYCSDEVKSLPVWSRNCFFDNEYQLEHFRNYRNSDCSVLCLVREVKKNCKCTPVYVPYIKWNRCALVNIPCVIAVRRNMSNWLTSENCPCLRDCESRQYRGDVTLGNFRAVEYALNKPYEGLVLNNTTSALHFFFSNPVYLKQKQETVMSIISLASNLGGVFGLSMGFSCISFLEILFYTYVGLRNYIRNYLHAN